MKNRNIIREKNGLTITFYVIVTLFTLICLFPFLLMISSSFMTEHEIITEGYKLIPDTWTTSAYQYVFNAPDQLINSYKVTTFITVVGTVAGVLFMSMTGFVLNVKSFKYRNTVAFFLYFTTLFSGGLVPTYLLYVKYLGLKDNILSMIFPGLLSAWSIFLMRNFMKSIPDALYESATIDGANDFAIYIRIYMPLSLPSLATVGLFAAIGYWNEWYNCMLYINNSQLMTLQYYLRTVVNKANLSDIINAGKTINATNLPNQSVKMAVACLATGPILLFYPFAQRYFVSGLTVGSVKG